MQEKSIRFQRSSRRLSTSQEWAIGSEEVLVQGTTVQHCGIHVCLLGKPQIFRLVAEMMSNPDRTLSRERAVEVLYGIEYRSSEKSRTYWESKDRGAVKQISRARAMFNEFFVKSPFRINWFHYDRNVRAWRFYEPLDSFHDSRVT